jgi:hypothetical protein
MWFLGLHESHLQLHTNYMMWAMDYSSTISQALNFLSFNDLNAYNPSCSDY